MRDFRLQHPDPSVPSSDSDSAETMMVEWELDEATHEYMAATAHGAVMTVFGSVLVLLAITLGVTVGMSSALVVMGFGAVLTPTAIRAVRGALVAHRRMGRARAAAQALRVQASED